MLHSVDFWKKFGNIGIKKKPTIGIPWEVVENDGTIIATRMPFLIDGSLIFEQLLNQQLVPDMSDSANLLNISQCTADLTPLGSVITIDEVQGALNRSKNGKSLGDDGIPVEVLRKDVSAAYLLTLSDPGYFRHLTIRGGGGFKRHPLRSRKLLWQSSPYHTCAFYWCFRHVPIGIFQKFAILTILQRFQI